MRRASAWIAPSRPAPGTSANTVRRSRKVFESLATCPDDLLLFLHHVPYTHKLHSGKTVIQYLYDSHYDGADARGGIGRGSGRRCKPLVDEQRYRDVLAQLEYQAGQAIVWRDAVTRYSRSCPASRTRRAASATTRDASRRSRCS